MLQHREDVDAQRSKIDQVLNEDARLHSTFAMARRCAVLALVETCQASAIGRPVETTVASTLETLYEYERRRGGYTLPSEAATRYAKGLLTADEVHAYERARGDALPIYKSRTPMAPPSSTLIWSRSPANVVNVTPQPTALRDGADRAVHHLVEVISIVAKALAGRGFCDLSAGAMLNCFETTLTVEAFEQLISDDRNNVVMALDGLRKKIGSATELARLHCLAKKVPKELLASDSRLHLEQIISWLESREASSRQRDQRSGQKTSPRSLAEVMIVVANELSAYGSTDLCMSYLTAFMSAPNIADLNDRQRDELVDLLDRLRAQRKQDATSMRCILMWTKRIEAGQQSPWACQKLLSLRDRCAANLDALTGLP